MAVPPPSRAGTINRIAVATIGLPSLLSNREFVPQMGVENARIVALDVDSSD